MSAYLNSIGLLLDIVGAVMLWRYGLPEVMTRTGAQYLVTGQINEALKARAARHHLLSKIGIFLLITGFSLQLLSNLMSPASAADLNLKAAAALAGMTAGMAAGCDLDSKPVLLEFRALIDRSGVTQAEREKLNDAAIEASALGLRMQNQSGSMPCPEVKARMNSTINTLRTTR